MEEQAKRCAGIMLTCLEATIYVGPILKDVPDSTKRVLLEQWSATLYNCPMEAVERIIASLNEFPHLTEAWNKLGDKEPSIRAVLSNLVMEYKASVAPGK
jgi:hypothetical protein